MGAYLEVAVALVDLPESIGMESLKYRICEDPSTSRLARIVT